MLIGAGIADGEQDGDVLADLGEEGGGDSRVKVRVATGPVEALQLIYENGTFGFADGYGQRERIGLSFAGEWTNDGQAAGAVITDVSEHQCGPALGLFAGYLGIEVEEDDIAGVRHIGSHHSTFSFPTPGPAKISS